MDKKTEDLRKMISEKMEAENELYKLWARADKREAVPTYTDISINQEDRGTKMYVNFSIGFEILNAKTFRDAYLVGIRQITLP